MNVSNDKNTWRDIRAALHQDITDGVLQTGVRLPTEPELAEMYDAGRHSVRRAVAELASEGLLSVEQGRGTYVQAKPMIRYAIGKRTRLSDNMKSEGVQITGGVTASERMAARPRVAVALGICVGDPVTVTRRAAMGDGVPVSIGAIYHDASRFPEFPERRIKMGSTTLVYASYGIDDYIRASTEIHARAAREDEARQLHQHPDMPVMILRAIDADLSGRPLSFSEVVWSAARVKFSVKPEAP